MMKYCANRCLENKANMLILCNFDQVSLAIGCKLLGKLYKSLCGLNVLSVLAALSPIKLFESIIIQLILIILYFLAGSCWTQN